MRARSKGAGYQRRCGFFSLAQRRLAVRLDEFKALRCKRQSGPCGTREIVVCFYLSMASPQDLSDPSYWQNIGRGNEVELIYGGPPDNNVLNNSISTIKDLRKPGTALHRNARNTTLAVCGLPHVPNRRGPITFLPVQKNGPNSAFRPDHRTHASIAAAKRRSCDPLVGKNGRETATIDATQVQDSESVNVRLWHLADSLSEIAARPLLGVNQTFASKDLDGRLCAEARSRPRMVKKIFTLA